MLVFQKTEPQMLETAGLPKPIQMAAIELNELVKWFKSFKIDSIELSVEGTAKTGTIPSLFISAEGKGGM